MAFRQPRWRERDGRMAERGDAGGVEAHAPLGEELAEVGDLALDPGMDNL